MTMLFGDLALPNETTNYCVSSPDFLNLLLNDILFIHSVTQKFNHLGTSLVAQWLRIHLPMQGTQVRAPVWEDPTCRRATKPVRHKY